MLRESLLRKEHKSLYSVVYEIFAHGFRETQRCEQNNATLSVVSHNITKRFLNNLIDEQKLIVCSCLSQQVLAELATPKTTQFLKKLQFPLLFIDIEVPHGNIGYKLVDNNKKIALKFQTDLILKQLINQRVIVTPQYCLLASSKPETGGLALIPKVNDQQNS